LGNYRVRVRRGDFEVEVDSSDKDYTESKLKELLATGSQAKPPAGREPTGTARKAETPTAGKGLSLAEHVRSLAPKSGAQHVIAVGDYLERYGGMADGFKTRDVAAGFTTIKYKHSNPAEAVRQAKSQGLLMDAKEDGAMVITSTAEAWVKTQLGAGATEDKDGA
jgi:hypothetical protein